MRRAFVAVHVGEAADAVARSQRIADALDRDGRWRRAASGAGWSIWTWGDAPFAVREIGDGAGFMIGDVFAWPGAHPPQHRSGDAGDLIGSAERLSRDRWGSYVALLATPGGYVPGVFRDPTGMIECFAWSAGDGVEVVASDLADLPFGVGPRHLALNWDRIAAFVAAPPISTWASLFDDLRAVGPGELVLPASGRSHAIWTPARSAATAVTDLEAASCEVRARLDHCTAALVSNYDRVLVELSGGLDSSVLAGTLHELGLAPRVRQWLNGVYGRAESDEDLFARAVTDRIGVELTTVRRAPDPLAEADVMELAAQMRPALDGIDAGRDRDEAARLRAVGAQAIVSGQGGDGAFFQMPSALVAADELRRRGCGALSGRLIADVARRTRKSVWAVLAEGRRAARSRTSPSDFTSSLVAPALRAAMRDQVHPWVREALDGDLPLGKKLHIQAIANLQAYHWPSRRFQAADLLLPLAAQPVLEACLAIATPDLAGANYDRPFERQAFADRLPALVLQRREKGNVTAHFAKLVAASLPWLRPFLLDGCLCRAGVLDRPALDRILDPNQLIWDAKPSEILAAATVEAWVRHWQGWVPDSGQAPRPGRSAA